MSGSAPTYECTVCGWVYDEAVGDPDAGIPPGTRWEDLPDDWVCPVCGAGKEDFEAIEAAPAPAPEATHDRRPIVIVGSGLAGYTLAREIRKFDAEVPLTVLTADGGEVYTKPMLSNAHAKGHTPDALVQKPADAFAADLGLEVRPRTRVLRIDREDRCVAVEGGVVSYDRLVLAVGADPRVFPAPGSDAVGIATVNDLDDYRAWRDRIDGGGRVLLIGAGLIGCEFANDLAGAGHAVAVVDPAPWPLARLLPQEIGDLLTGALEGLGVAFHLGRTVSAYVAEGNGFIAVLDDGTRVPFDHALSAVGLAPRTGLAKDAGLEVKAGIVVDSVLRTADPEIFAIGDCAETAAGPLPFIAPLLAEARALAATLTGTETALHLPALPVVVKTPALPLVVCPPKPGADGGWSVERTDTGAIALFRAPDGTELGFALAGGETARQQEFGKRMPDLLGGGAVAEDAAGDTWECGVCSWVYDPREGDAEGGIEPGTPWEDLPDDWVCPVCGAGKEEFSRRA